ncbi:CRTISO [Symbiodinium pilosum]|uniref:CRTISO protein n=1 Tax=Symbiodinium pilosum TaxID=2952 RepID=A0A812WKK1_SYMPI|nr:CRTISO [Symbiodinium pilosum]
MLRVYFARQSHGPCFWQPKDVVVIGSGLGGLSCGAVLASAGREVTVCESHYRLGGACHTFSAKVPEIGEFHFESGPSLYSGLSLEASPSQLKHVLQIVGEEPEWISYDRWNAFLPEGEVNVAVGYQEVVEKLLPKYGGPDAVGQWQRLMAELKPMSSALYNSPPFGALRDDSFVPITMGRYARRLLPLFSIPGGAARLSQPFEAFLDEAGVSDKFIRNYLSLFSFLLQGLPSYGSPTSMMAYMMADLYRKGGTCLDYPKGGSEAIVQALVSGIETKSPSGRVWTKAHVEEILVESGRAVGVRLRNGSILRAREAVICGTDVGVAKSLIKDKVPELEAHFQDQWSSFEPLKSFIHIHVAFRGEGLPRQHCPEFPAQWGVVDHWEDLEAPRNCVLVSVPSLLDDGFAPEGYHSLHAYTPATEPWEDWQELSKDEYQRKKREAGDFLYKAIQRQVPDIRSRVVFEKVGTPLTHARFLRKPRGAYGWRVLAGSNLPGHTTPLPGLHVCGDSTYPGIGVPSAAMSGHICANNILSVAEHWSLLDRIPEWQYELDM